MKGFVRVLIPVVAGLALAIVVSSTASASCANPLDLRKGGVTPAAFFSGGAPLLMRTSMEDSRIVGLWQFTFTSVGNAALGIPDGAPLDMGYAAWHSDGTEIMNSSRDPATGSFCLGAWDGDGPRSYRLNHFALAWDSPCKTKTDAPATSCFVGPTNIREHVTVDPHGDTYSGTVTIDQYDNHQNLVMHLTGTVSARRITAD
ncbi:MAG TPA: hypothetical protein VGL62_10530 [Vicinamibacterales bacterium]|jgi:hypothetical protein